MKRYVLTIQYDGTNYCGWQSQKNGESVQQVLVRALKTIAVGEVKLVGSGRTDAGVHAEAQVAHVDMETSVPAKKISLAVNAKLPDDVRVLSSKEAGEGFHARYSAKKKTYLYSVYVADTVLPLKDRYSLRIDKLPDIEKMKEGAKVVVGKHDFRCFLASGSSVVDTVREIYSIDIIQKGEEIVFLVCGSGFLYNMVRIIVGTLLDIGYGKKKVEDLAQAIEEKNRKLCGKTVSAKGLRLHSVEY
ncbi:MAG: tRNA pseudouridine(38-40) synthase TruA [Clostridia bacterium]|nr:tRNA pseudouridine(38-40) synthase TruA [Clostridia bacterium]